MSLARSLFYAWEKRLAFKDDPERRVLDFQWGAEFPPPFGSWHPPALLHGPEQIADLPVPVVESPGAVRIGHPERGHLVEYLAVLPPLSVGKMTLRLYGALNYSHGLSKGPSFGTRRD